MENIEAPSQCSRSSPSREAPPHVTCKYPPPQEGNVEIA